MLFDVSFYNSKVYYSVPSAIYCMSSLCVLSVADTQFIFDFLILFICEMFLFICLFFKISFCVVQSGL